VNFPHKETLMMRTSLFLAVAALVTFAPAASSAAEPQQTQSALKGTGKYGVAGCGLGSMAFGDQPGGIQILAATTNGLLGNQTFGISSGTSNCGKSAFAQGTKNFVEANREALAKDISRGQGESIGALTVINACADSRAVGTALQKSFSVIFPDENVSNDDVTKAILRTLGDKSLGCGGHT
jgi:hypothetical protein